eukprot:3015566-Pleurochrysis_carterae.AAC.3
MPFHCEEKVLRGCGMVADEHLRLPHHLRFKHEFLLIGVSLRRPPQLFPFLLRFQTGFAEAPGGAAGA